MGYRFKPALSLQKAGQQSDTFIFSMGGRHDTVIGAGADDTIRLNQIAAFTSVSDFAGHLSEDSGGTLLDFGYLRDHPDIYGTSIPNAYIGRIYFQGLNAQAVQALDWEFV